MRTKRAFTLIELLVVIAIIALLLSIIIPSLNLAKKKAASAVCLTREHNLSLAWRTYAYENDDYMVNSDTMFAGDQGYPSFWVEPPQMDDGTRVEFADVFNGGISNGTLEDRKRGIERGALYPYLNSTDFYHCPGDQRNKNPEGDIRCAWRSYSIVAGLNSWYAGDPGWAVPIESGGADYYAYTKLSKVKTAASALCFVEEAEQEAGYNSQSWAMYVTIPRLWDPLSIFHGNSSTLGYIDGHAEQHKWIENDIIRMFTEGDKWMVFTADNVDYLFLLTRYPYERLRYP